MDLLRWILLGVGVLVIIGVYWWSRRNAREEEQFFRTEPGVSGADDEEFDPLFATHSRAGTQHGSRQHAAPVLTTDDGEPDLEAVHRELSSLQALLQAEDRAGRGSFTAADPEDAQESADALSVTAVEPAVQEKLLVLYLVAHPNQIFTASAIGESLQALGLVYGDMHIYHRYPDAGGDAPVFGVANLVEPGTLEPEALAETGTPGLTLFLQLPGPLPPLAAFDLFSSTAQQLTVRLDGELRDKHRTVVSRQMLEHLRDEIQQYARRLHLQQHA
ncbi:MAG TPA: cell division protein ZipA [Gammaproteobacteria bacterium]